MTAVKPELASVVAAPEATERVRMPEYAPIDAALLRAFEGDFTGVYTLEDQGDRRAVATAAHLFGVEVPADLETKIPTFADVADRLRTDTTLADLFLTAEKFSGVKTGGERARARAASVARAAVFVPNLALGAAGTIAAKTDHHATAKVIDMAEFLVASPRTLAEYASRVGPAKLFRIASSFVKREYDVEYHNNPAHLLPWLRARILGEIARFPYSRNESLQKAAGAFMGASVNMTSIVTKAHMMDGERAVGAGLPILRSDLERGRLIREAGIRFLTEEKAARQARAKAHADYFKPKPSTRPHGEALDMLGLSSDLYQDRVTLQYDIMRKSLDECLRDIAEEPGSRHSYETLAEIWAATIERSRLSGYGQEKFAQLAMNQRARVVPLLRRYLPTVRQQVQNGTASMAVVRLIADRHHPDYSFDAVATDKDQVLLDALDNAAFDWFGTPFKLYSSIDSIRCTTREAYIAARLALSGKQSMQLLALRAERLLAVDVVDKWRRRGLHQEVVGWMELAKDVPGRPKRKRR